jgi:hypothetical protein
MIRAAFMRSLRRSPVTIVMGLDQLETLELPAAAQTHIDVALSIVDHLNTQLVPLDAELRAIAAPWPATRALQAHYGIGPLTGGPGQISGGATAAFHGCRSAVGANRARQAPGRRPERARVRRARRGSLAGGDAGVASGPDLATGPRCGLNRREPDSNRGHHNSRSCRGLQTAGKRGGRREFLHVESFTPSAGLLENWRQHVLADRGARPPLPWALIRVAAVVDTVIDGTGS